MEFYQLEMILILSNSLIEFFDVNALLLLNGNGRVREISSRRSLLEFPFGIVPPDCPMTFSDGEKHKKKLFGGGKAGDRCKYNALELSQ